ncbi:hypothetical protein SK128_018029 [Halocaridina rubra]|uniref:Uncharacterized protein n=1 Tax=Halocaridina rubra TaxID=373956 RepID=A0AAN8X4P5_HALRR
MPIPRLRLGLARTGHIVANTIRHFDCRARMSLFDDREYLTKKAPKLFAHFQILEELYVKQYNGASYSRYLDWE